MKIKKYSLISLLFMLFGSLSFSQNTLEASRGILSNDTSGEGVQVWGDNVTLEAFKIDGSQAIIKFDQQFRDKGFGIQGARWDQIDYYRDYQGNRVHASEKLRINFNGPVKDVLLKVGMLGLNEGIKEDDETGKWTAYNSKGERVAHGVFGPDDSDLGPEIKYPNSYGKYPFRLQSEKPIYYIDIEATAFGYGNGDPKYVNSYNNDSGNKENNSDFNITGISYTRIDIVNENQPPVAISDGSVSGDPLFTVTLNQTLKIPFELLLSNDSDPDGDDLSIVSVQRQRGGDVKIVDDYVEFLGTVAIPGALFTYTISDGRGGTASANVLLNVVEPAQDNRPPIAKDDNLGSVREDIGITGFDYSVLLNNDVDPDGDEIKIKQIDFSNFPGNVDNRPNEEKFYFVTNVNFNGNIVFDYTIEDSKGAVDTGQITLTITDVLDELSFGEDGPFQTNSNQSIEISFDELTANDVSSANEIEIAITVIGNVKNGSVFTDNDKIRFTPNNNFVGEASFTYSVEVIADTFGGPRPVDVGTSPNIKINVVKDGSGEPSFNQKAILLPKSNNDVFLQVEDKQDRAAVLVENCKDLGLIWNIKDRGNGYHKIENDYASKVLECWRPSPSNGDDVTIYSSNNKDWQQWKIINAGNGYYKIKGKYNSRFLTYVDGKTIVSDDNQSDNQLWKIGQPEDLSCVSNSGNSAPIAVGDGAVSGDPFYTLDLGETIIIPFDRLLRNDIDPDGDDLTIISVQSQRAGNVRIVGNNIEFTGTAPIPGALFTYTISDGIDFSSANVLLNVEETDSTDTQEEIVLTTSNLDISEKSDPILWGECVMLSAMTINGNSGILIKKRGSIGIKGGRNDFQLDYMPKPNKSEKMIIDFNRNIKSATITLSNLEEIEYKNMNETGNWTIKNKNGEIIGRGIFNPSIGEKIARGVYKFEVSNVDPFERIEISATAYNSGIGYDIDINNSDFSLKEISFVPFSGCNENNKIFNEKQFDRYFQVFPTKVHNEFSVKSRESEDATLKIFNMTGQQVLIKRISGESSIDVSNYNSGIYIIQISNSKNKEFFKILKY